MANSKIEPRALSFGGFSVKRYLPLHGINGIGPWVFFDHLGPHEFEPGKGIDVIPHPHINLGTVTYLFEGEIVHRDTLGSIQTIRPGEVNLMVAGKGIAHSERTGDEMRKKGHRLHGIQLWHALPEHQEEMEPMFSHYPGNEIPSKTINGVQLRVIIGETKGLTSPVKTYSKSLFCVLYMPAGTSFEPESDDETGIYLVSGAADYAGFEMKPGSFIRSSGNKDLISASAESVLVMIGGKSLGKRYMWWNFVSSRKTRIETAKKEWDAMSYGYVKDDSKERAKLPGEDSYSIME